MAIGGWLLTSASAIILLCCLPDLPDSFPRLAARTPMLAPDLEISPVSGSPGVTGLPSRQEARRSLSGLGNPDVDHGAATVEGVDVMLIGNGVVLIGMGERTTPQALTQIARALLNAHFPRAGLLCT
jgi:hypothetical protein